MKKVKLGEVLKVTRGPSLSGHFYSEFGQLIRLTLGNFQYPGNGFKYNTSKKNIYFIGEIDTKYILKKGDIITPLTEQVGGLLGNTAYIPKNNTFIQNNDIGLLHPNKKEVLSEYIYYLLSSQTIKKQLSASAQQTKIRHITPTIIENCVAWISNIETQHHIVDIIGTIDNKICNAQRTIDILKSLITFHYKIYLSNAKETHDTLLTRHFSFIKGDEPGSSNYINCDHCTNLIRHYRVRDLTSKCITYVDPSLTNARCKRNDVLVSFDGTVGKIAFGLEGSYSAGIRKIKSIDPTIHDSFIYGLFSEGTIIKNIQKYATGSNIKHASGSLNHVTCKIELKHIINYQQTCDQLYAKMIKSVQTIDICQKYKDQLLKLLLNGAAI